MEQIHYKYTNKLINEKSPYLLQHAHNPVNWFPWDNEAFRLSKKENKPIFLSIGYSTCHWCHVMEKESFEDEEVANLMNNIFISIKVDREERPDIDSIYMNICQMLNGNGGWPLTIIMTPDKKPFFAGTYFPKYSVSNRIGMIDLIREIDNAWKNEKDKIYESAEKITSYLISNKNKTNQDLLDDSISDKAFNFFNKSFDKIYGGFGSRPKFPSPHNLSFLMRYYSKTKNNHALDMVIKTLTEMRKGGIFDHIGFGFHRYSTDQKWFLPHFEKMLYDQALLTIAYTEVFQITKNPIFEQTVKEILTYVLRDLTSKEGGFFSAEDADSEGEEGKFYLWKKNEILTILGDKNGELFCKIYNISESGNYYEEATHKFNGTNIPFIDGDLAKNYERLESFRQKLFEAREKRIHPFKDDKILTDWNGLMISALALAGKVFNNKKYIHAAEKGYEFIITKLGDNSGKIFHRYRDNDIGINGQIDDYSFFIWASLELFEATFKSKYLIKAIDLTNFVTNNFWDYQNNLGFFLTSHLDSDLIIRPIEYYDGVIPSGNSVMYLNLIKLSKLTVNDFYKEYADKLNSLFKDLVESSPTGFSYFLCGLIFSSGLSSEIIIAEGSDTSNCKEIMDKINQSFIPNKVIVLINEQNRNELSNILPFLEEYKTINDKTTVFVCKNFRCNLPLNDKEKVIELIQELL